MKAKPAVKPALERIWARGDRRHWSVRRPNLEWIARCVSEAYALPHHLLFAHDRRPHVVGPRWAAFAIAHRSGWPMEAIGRYFGGHDHTTVMHGIRRFAEKCKLEPDYRADAEEACLSILGACVLPVFKSSRGNVDPVFRSGRAANVDAA